MKFPWWDHSIMFCLLLSLLWPHSVRSLISKMQYGIIWHLPFTLPLFWTLGRTLSSSLSLVFTLPLTLMFPILKSLLFYYLVSKFHFVSMIGKLWQSISEKFKLFSHLVDWYAFFRIFFNGPTIALCLLYSFVEPIETSNYINSSFSNGLCIAF